MGRVNVRLNKVLVDRPLKPEYEETAAKGFEQGRTDAIAKDLEIESDASRLRLSTGEGDISIIVTAGEEPGDVSVSVQFEGPKGQHKECLTAQGDLIRQTADWLREILGQFGTDWHVDMLSAPCPHGDTRLLQLTRAMHVIQGQVDVQVQGDVTIEPRVAVQIDGERKP